ncbi:MAG TPA: helix-turn-helix domain-containing protein [Gaiellaceae bacterium]|nr:helix-turn-helix domain-containing protein [Gaiellaceae bacterium]
MKRVRLNHVDDPRRFGQRLREARENAGLSQHALSFPGCTNAYLSRIEAGERTPSLQLIHELARRLDVSPEWLATGVDGAPPVDRELIDAEVALRLGEVDEARAVFARRLRENPRDTAALAGFGELAFRDGHYTKAITLLEQALERASLVDQSTTVETLARAHAAAGALEAAKALLERAVDQAVAAGATVEEFRFRVLLANALIDASEPKLAERQLVAAMQHAERLNDPIATARIYWTQSRLHVQHNRNPKLGVRYARRAIDILERTENSSYVAMAYHLLACAQNEAGEPKAALEQLDRGRQAFGTALTPSDDARFGLEEARALLMLGDAKAAARRAGEVFDQIGVLDPNDRGRTTMVIAHVFRKSGDTARAVQLYQLALDDLEKRAPHFAGEAGASLAELLEELGRPNEALAVYKRVVSAQRASAAAADADLATDVTQPAPETAALAD